MQSQWTVAILCTNFAAMDAKTSLQTLLRILETKGLLICFLHVLAVVKPL